MNATKPVSLNLNVRGMGQSATLFINERSKQLQEEGRSIYRFGLGQSPFPVPDPVVEALRQAAPEKDYLPVRGLRELREAVAAFHRKVDGIDADLEGVIIGPGSKELMFLLQLCFYGEINITSPCWVSYVPQAHILGRQVAISHRSMEDGWKLTAEMLHAEISHREDDHRPRLLVMNYPGNPTGQTYTEDELKEIAEVVRRYEIVILSDEIYGMINYEGRHVSIAHYYPEGTIVSSGLSKWCGAGGWRLGTFYFPPDLRWLMDAMADVASETYTSVSAPIQHAAVHAFRGGVEVERYLWHTRRILRALATECVDIFHQAGIRVLMPAGGFYLFLDFSEHRERLAKRGIHNGPALTNKLLDDTGVAILPGYAFCRDYGELTARLAFVDFDGARVLTASENTSLHEDLPADFCRTWCSWVLEGVSQIAEWIARDE